MCVWGRGRGLAERDVLVSRPALCVCVWGGGGGGGGGRGTS